MKTQPHILLVEDEPFLAQVISESLEKIGYSVAKAADGDKGLKLFLEGSYQLCIVDVMLPLMDGFALAKQIRMHDHQVPLLFLTARTETKDVVEGYASGGNDYLKKPFGLEELFVRIKELLNRASVYKGDTGKKWIGDYEFSSVGQTLKFREKQAIQLSHRESQLLELLYKFRNQVLERKKVLIEVWGDDNFFNTRTMDVFISRLRKYLTEDENVRIINIRGYGYKLIC